MVVFVTDSCASEIAFSIKFLLACFEGGNEGLKEIKKRINYTWIAQQLYPCLRQVFQQVNTGIILTKIITYNYFIQNSFQFIYYLSGWRSTKCSKKKKSTHVISPLSLCCCKNHPTYERHSLPWISSHLCPPVTCCCVCAGTNNYAAVLRNMIQLHN